ncbi:MAG: alpha/beta fold hydrolase [Chloroflexi bacterium]|nr:alpha/beta fold hydrolase [Chloroflexota bacterium]
MYAHLPDGLRLYYVSQGAGPAVVLVHGLSGSHVLWERTLPALAGRYRAIALDLRGHGQSDKPPGPYSVAGFAADLALLLDQLAIERAVLVGLSMGGGTVQTFALNYPERVRALVLVSTSSEFTPEVRERFHQWAARAEREGMGALAEALVASWVAPAFRTREPAEFARQVQITAANAPHAFAASARANAQRDWTAQLPRITCPVLFVGGECDGANPQRAAAIYRQYLPEVEIHLVPGAGHYVPLEAPETFNRLLLAFLDRVTAR